MGFTELLFITAIIISLFYIRNLKNKNDKYCQENIIQLKKIDFINTLLDQATVEKNLLKEEIKNFKKNPDGTLQILNDLSNNCGVVLYINRVDPSSIYLRSPRE